MATKEMLYALEEMIDKTSLAKVVEMLVVIAYEKANHVAVNWQDESMAKAWVKAGRILQSAEPKIIEQLGE